MNYGIQISASGALSSMHRQDVLTGNLANLGTAGFKPLITGTQFRPAVRQEDGLSSLPSNALLERLGGGVLSAHAKINFAQGPMEMSSSRMDVAINGEGFFVIGHDGGQALSRDGRMTVNSSGTLVQSSSGRAVLDADGGLIQVDPALADLVIHGDGLVTQGDVQIGRFALGDVNDRSVLTKFGEGLFVSKYGGDLNIVDGQGAFKQFAYESSAVNEINALMKIQSAARSAQGNIGMIDMQNRMMDKTINTFGRIA